MIVLDKHHVTNHTLCKLADGTIHELKNPLTAINALAQLGQITPGSDKKNTVFQRIICETENLNKLLEELNSR